MPTLRVGSVISLYSSFLKRVGDLSEESLGNFIIIEITHEVSQGSYYKNRFKAIPATIKALPSPKVRMPLAETQMATVLSNADPEGKGRVRVRMNWQTDGMQTGWVRVMTPDGGSSSDVKSNRGFVFIPEVGDQVLLGFRHGDPARPYVMGSLFNGTTGGGGGQGNKCKSLTTRSGSSLKLDDSDGSVTLHDKGGVSMNFDGAGCSSFDSKKNSTLNAGQNHTINAGSNSSVNAGANYSANVGKGASCLNMDANGDIVLEGKNKITIKVGENTITISADGIVTNAGSGDVKTTATTGSVTIESTSSEASFKGSTNTNIGGGDCTYVTATDVEINQS